jgi:hypothetical protein
MSGVAPVEQRGVESQQASFATVIQAADGRRHTSTSAIRGAKRSSISKNLREPQQMTARRERRTRAVPGEWRFFIDRSSR